MVYVRTRNKGNVRRTKGEKECVHRTQKWRRALEVFIREVI